jgi:DNA-binding NtrC family response regulator
VNQRSAPGIVLVIDDEMPIRRLVQRMLEPEVCRVLDAADAETGLRMIERDNPPVNAVLTDWIMPGLDGLDVLEVLHLHRPDLPVAVISGYTSTIHTVIRSGTGLRILQKPFTAREVQRTVAEMIASPAGARMRDRDPLEHAAANPGTPFCTDLVAAAWEIHHARHRAAAVGGPSGAMDELEEV